MNACAAARSELIERIFRNSVTNQSVPRCSARMPFRNRQHCRQATDARGNPDRRPSASLRRGARLPPRGGDAFSFRFVHAGATVEEGFQQPSGGRRSGGHFRRPFIPAGWTWTPGRTCPRGVPNPPGRPRLCRLWHRPTQSRADQGPTIDRAHSLPLMMCGFKSRSDPTLPRAPRPRRMSFDRSMWTGFRKLPPCVSRSRIVRLSDVVFSRTLVSHGT